jgi:hypothetical protein
MWLLVILLFVSTLSYYDKTKLPCPYEHLGEGKVYQLNSEEELVVTIYPNVSVIVNSRDGLAAI